MERNKVFVYGTLKRGCRNHRFLRGARFLGEAALADFAMYRVASYPGIVPFPGERVTGEVYEVDARTLQRLDMLEDEGELYERRLLTVTKADGEMLEAWVYVWKGDVPEKKRIETGTWEELKTDRRG